MKKLRWAMDGGFWDVDMTTPRTLDGQARPVPGDPLPLGLSRGTRLSRPKQIDFMQRFMFAPFVPSYAAASHGFSLHRVLTLPFSENWFATLLGQFNVQEFVANIKGDGETQRGDSSWWQTVGKHLQNKSLYALNLCSEILLTHEDTILLSIDYSEDNKTPRKKAVFHHKFPHHNLTVEAAWPGLFVDASSTYWDVPALLSVDLASVAYDSGASYHLCMHHNAGLPEQVESGKTCPVPATLLPGLSVKGAFSYKMNFDIWRSKAEKLKMVQPYDIFLSDPLISASLITGAVLTSSLGDNYIRSQAEGEPEGFKGICFRSPQVKSSFLADLFASVTLTAQHGNFQRLFLDLTRCHARLDFPSGSKFLSGAARLAQDYFNSQQPSLDAIQAVCPNATLSLQQQIAGPFSFRVDSGVAVDLKTRDWPVLRVEEPIFAIEYAMQVLGSAKAVAWYSPKQKEFMVELRFFET